MFARLFLLTAPVEDRAAVVVRSGVLRVGLEPVSRDKVPRDGQATAYVCTRGLCEAPTTDPDVLRAQLLSKPDPR